MPKSFEQLSISELKNVRKLQKQKLNEYSEYKKKQKLIADIKK